IARLKRDGQPVTATIVGDGPDRGTFEAAVAAQKLTSVVRFAGAMPARAAFALGRLLVVPSRAESLPYIVLEGAAAGLPIIATRVGGLPEIFGGDSAALVAPNDAAALACAIGAALRDPATQKEAALRLQEHVRAAFSTKAMTDAILAAYRESSALTLRNS